MRFVPREASSGAASSTRRAWGPKAAGKPGEASPSAAEVQGEPESGDTRQKSVDAWTVLSSDDSDASVFNLRGGVYASDGEWSDGEESLVSSDNEDAEVERHKVAQWRQAEFLQNDNDFAFVYVNFEEAYAGAGRAVAMAWARCRQRAELSLATDAAHVLAISASMATMRA